MFHYFGRKVRLGPLYPEPRYDTVIEPFAGSMAYTLLHKPEHGIGLDMNPKVVDTWNRLCGMSESEILAYPPPTQGEYTEDWFVIQAAFNESTIKADGRQVTSRMVKDFRSQVKYAAKHVRYAKDHVDMRFDHYRNAPDIEATWFIDPPYQHVNRGYIRADLDFEELGEWCRTRKGQVIVCEQEGADWLPFKPLVEHKGLSNIVKTEVYWLND